MPDSEDEEKLLIQREYNKHKEHIHTHEMRELHLESKNEGYAGAIKFVSHNEPLLFVFFGYLSACKLDLNKVADVLVEKILDNSSELFDRIRNILAHKYESEYDILEQLR